jgi:hypothetical protein
MCPEDLADSGRRRRKGCGKPHPVRKSDQGKQRTGKEEGQHHKNAEETGRLDPEPGERTGLNDKQNDKGYAVQHGAECVEL